MKPSIISTTVRVLFKAKIYDIKGYDDGTVFVRNIHASPKAMFKIPVTRKEKKLEMYYRENFYDWGHMDC